MIKEGKFGVQEAVCVLVITMMSKIFFTSPSVVMKTVGTAGWYMTLISACTATIGFTFVYLLLKRFPGKNIMQAYDLALGRFWGFVFSLVLFSIILLTASANIREFAEVLKVYVLPLSPPSFIIGFICAVFVLAAFLGLESIARVSKLFAWVLLLGLLTVLALSTQNYSLYRIFPIFGYGIGTTVYNGILRSSAYGDLIIIAIFADSLQGIKHVKKAGYLSFAITGVLTAAILLTFTMAFPYHTGREITAPMYLLTSLIDYGGFFKRLEPIFLFVWNTISTISSTVLFYMALTVYCHMFRIQDKKPLIMPFAIVLFSLTMIPKGMAFLVTCYIQALRMYGWIMFFLPPLAALLIAKIRKKKGDTKNA